MAAPNLRSPATVTGKTATAALTTSLSTVLQNAASSGKVLKVNTVRAANVAAATVTVDIAHHRGIATTYLIKGGSVDSGKTLITTDKNEYIYLEEGDELQAKASAGTSIDLTINYEEIS
jgi:NADPH-dependent ferric siderophore reductase